MDQRISFVTLAVADLVETYRFYVDGLGWKAQLYVPGEVLMIKAGEHLVLSLWAEAGFEAEVGTIRRGKGIVPTSASNPRTVHSESTRCSPALIISTSSGTSSAGSQPSPSR